MLSTLVTTSHYNFLIVVQVSFGDTLYLLTHRRGEKQGVTFCRYSLQNSVDTLRETHIQHLVRLVKYHIIDIIQLGNTTIHQVYQSTGCCHDNLYPFS